ncbi:MAG: hypothetical protein KAR40_12105 [Candidatus Sabulitectum sp.]|nr:hypothetical protein [Candidatus Sabulitectum sp.]
MIPVKPIVDTLKKVDWKKTAEVAGKIGGGVTVVVATIKKLKDMKGDDGISKKTGKELKDLDKMLKKGRITRQEYETMRAKIINM